ncbi:MAG: solute-binding protein [Chloroflexi bacterium]|jgi:tungstate transport system substrate-binding protein|nr:solute-binding protein [Chloroflexota bacterium]
MKTIDLKKLLFLSIVSILLLTTFGCTQEPENKVIRMSTTTSVNDSGLMAYLQPEFEKATGYTLEITSAGTGAAIEKGRMGDADILLVHSKSAEEEFIAEGFEEVRLPFMYNFFVIVGPAGDPAGVAGSATAAEAFKKIADSGSLFISRGDESGTNNKENAIWKSIEIDPTGQEWYDSVGQGMGQTLTIADEKQAYTLSDKATFLAHEDNLSMILEETDDMKNTYSMIIISAKRFAESNVAGAQAFVDWIKTDQARKMIAEFGVAEYGEPLFFNLD